MNRKLKVLLSVIAMSFVMVGCGSSGGGSSAPVVDNSTLADGQNEYGYWGSRVMLGDFTLARKWTLSSPTEAKDLYLIFPTDTDVGFGIQGINIFDFSFGVSANAQSITVDDYNNQFKLTLGSPQSDHCYNATFSNINTGQTSDVTACAESDS